MSEANYAVKDATADFQSVRNWTFGIRTLAGSTIEARSSQFASFVTRNSAFGIPTALATGNGNLPAKALAQAGANKAKGDLRWPSARTLGQESNPTTWRLARMNLAIRGIEGDLGDEPADSFHGDLHKDLKADYILAE